MHVVLKHLISHNKLVVCVHKLAGWIKMLFLTSYKCSLLQTFCVLLYVHVCVQILWLSNHSNVPKCYSKHLTLCNKSEQLYNAKCVYIWSKGVLQPLVQTGFILSFDWKLTFSAYCWHPQALREVLHTCITVMNSWNLKYFCAACAPITKPYYSSA